MWNYLLNFRYGILHIGRVGSVLTTFSVAMERYFAIKYPLNMIKKSRSLILFCLLFSILYNIPRFLEFETSYVDVSGDIFNMSNYKEKVLINPIQRALMVQRICYHHRTYYWHITYYLHFSETNICSDQTAFKSCIHTYLHCMDEIHLDRSYSLPNYIVLQCCNIRWVSTETKN